MRVGRPRFHNFHHRKVAVGGRAVGQAPQVRSAPIARRRRRQDLVSVNFLKITFQYLTLDIMHLGYPVETHQHTAHAVLPVEGRYFSLLKTDLLRKTTTTMHTPGSLLLLCCSPPASSCFFAAPLLLLCCSSPACSFCARRLYRVHFISALS